MGKIAQIMNAWENSRCDVIAVGSLLARNRITYKWKAPFRSFVIRECALWRFHDLLRQAEILDEARHVLGSRILLRSAMETIGILIYLNQLIGKVLEWKLDFHDFDKKTTKLLLGSRDGTTKHDSINIQTVLESCEKRYPNILNVYATLSESAHPNWEGLCFGYSKVDHDQYESRFSNRWSELRGSEFESLALIVSEIFEHEYNTVWPKLMENLEVWVEQNDVALESSKHDSS